MGKDNKVTYKLLTQRATETFCTRSCEPIETVPYSNLKIKMFKTAWKERSKGPPSSDNLFLGVVNVLLEPFYSEKACYCYCLLYIKHDINISASTMSQIHSCSEKNLSQRRARRERQVAEIKKRFLNKFLLSGRSRE